MLLFTQLLDKITVAYSISQRGILAQVGICFRLGELGFKEAYLVTLCVNC